MKQKSVLLTIAVLLGLRITATAQTPPAYVPTDSLVGWWPFNGNANDESGNGNNGTVNGATLTEDRFGMANAAYEFDGVDDRIDLCGLDVYNEFTISLWFHASDLTLINPTLAYFGIEGFGSDFTKSVDLSFDNVNFSPTRLRSSLNYDFGSAGTSNFNQGWNQATFKLENSQLYFYLNSELKELVSASKSKLMIESSICSRIGCGQNSLGSVLNFFSGQIDEIGFWNRALSQGEISDLYNANLCYETITVTDTLIINLNPTSYNPVTYQNTILMYPNPTSSELTINYGDFASLAGYTLKIFNSIGQEIHVASINQQQEVLPLNTWGGAGAYQVVIYNAQGVPVDTRTIVLQ